MDGYSGEGCLKTMADWVVVCVCFREDECSLFFNVKGKNDDGDG